MTEGKKFKKISKKEFCKQIRTEEDNWIFEKQKNPLYWHNVEDDSYYFNNGIDTVYRFKDMPEYGEIWMTKWDTKEFNYPKWTIWSTWAQYD